MTGRLYQPGDRVALADAPDTPVGEVVAVETLGDRQILRLQEADGAFRAVAVDHAGGIISGPVDLDEAHRLARAALSGRPLRVPEQLQLTTLASALLVLTPEHWRSA